MIELGDIRRAYRVGQVEVPALRGVSLRIASGEFVAILGASGSGKSTLMHILGCLDRPTSGSYRFEGEEVSRLSPRKLAAVRNQRIGFVFQGFNLLPRSTALENVELPLLYAGRTVIRTAQHRMAATALERVGLSDRKRHTPAQLSGGQQQRVAIARALVGNPALVLADEPTGNLDSATSSEILELLSGLNRQGITIILVTHAQDVAACARRRVTLRDGLVER